jgi:hypothetical protein
LRDVRVLGRPVILLLLVGTAIAGCGGRGNSSDAQPPAAVAAASATPLPETAFQVRWGTLTFPRTVNANTTVQVSVRMTNLGDTPWPDRASASPQKDGAYAVRVTHAFVRGGDAEGGRPGAVRTDLLRPVMPGESVDVPLTISTPAVPGDYNLTIELVQELVRWFADKGADRLVIPVRVVGAGAASSPSGR